MADGKIVIDVLLDDGSVAKGVANVDKQLGGLQGAGKKAALGIGKIVTALGLVAVGAKAIDLVRDSLEGAFNRIDTFEQFERVMTAVTGSSSLASKALDRTNEIVTGTGYTLDGAASSVQNFVTRGLSIDKATKYVEAFGDAVAFYGDGSQAQFENVQDALSKMVTKGKVEMDQLDRLFDAGIDAVGMYAKAMGRDAGSVQEDLSAGKISAEDFIETVSTAMMEGTNGVVNIAGAAKDAGATWGATFSNMRTAVSRGVANIISSIDEMLTSNGLPNMRSMVADFGSTFESALNKVADLIPIVAGKIQSVKSAIEPWIPTIQNVVEEVKSIIVDRISIMIDNAKQIFGSLVEFWDTNGASLLEYAKIYFGGIWDTVKTVLDAIKTVIQNVLGGRVIPFIQNQLEMLSQFWQENGSQIMQAVQNAFKFIQSVIEFVMPAVQFIIGVVWSAIQNIISGALNVIMGLIQVFTGIFTGDFSQLWEGIKKIFKGAIDLILGIMSFSFLGGLRTIFTNLLKSGVSIVKNLGTSIVNFFRNFSSNATNVAVNLVKSVVNYFKNLLSQGRNIFSQLRTFVTSQFKNLFSSIRNLNNNIKSTVTSIWNQVLKFLKGISLRNVGKDIIRGLINGIGSMANAVVDKVKSIGSSISNGFKSVLGIASPSKVMADLAKWIPVGIGEGIEKNEKKALKSLGDLTKNLTDSAQVDLGVTNRLRGIKMPLGNIIPINPNYNNQSVASMLGTLGKKIGNMNNDQKLIQQQLGPTYLVMDKRVVAELLADDIQEINEINALKVERAEGL